MKFDKIEMVIKLKCLVLSIYVYYYILLSVELNKGDYF
jgi:hypothetical protein